MHSTKERGMVLLVSLILLLMLTLIAITATNQATLQLRISSNSEQRSMAFQAAEAGIAREVSIYFTQCPPEGNGCSLKDDGAPAEIIGDSTISQKTAFTIVDPIAPEDCLPPGYGLEVGGAAVKMKCFDLTVKGGSVCDSNGKCEVEVVHSQGGRRRFLQ